MKSLTIKARLIDAIAFLSLALAKAFAVAHAAMREQAASAL